ncbi:hypothetical protein [Tsukamurella paurometabola]|uniref:Uncharacterized protein n=1 Tax=Tsukamurella paurometabola TaxID=2061 RepID=A0A3P8KTD1_TSUPA|nr:hypothetical protein [Tsukamurella paurometabola]UEA82955.1 hypothetical protein LK411_21775 [Tsukamurella paurometabola]VDR40037.1 Uncharacterised protein [Tsukamurella paurometabola]
MTDANTALSLCGKPVGAACLACHLEDCPAMTDVLLDSIRLCGRRGGLTGRDAAMVVTLLCGKLEPEQPPEPPHRRLRLV